MTTAERKSTYELVSERLATAIEGGNVPWHKPWRSIGAQANLVSKKPYRGINVWLTLLSGYESPWWVTFNQAKALGGSVRKGEKGTMVVYWQILRKQDHNAAGEQVEKRIPLLKYYTVFNVLQCDGLEAKIPAVVPPTVTDTDTYAAAEALWDGWAAPGVSHVGDRAYYVPALDIIQMPARSAFVSLDAYYQTLFHEGIHATGHESRLHRWAKDDATQFKFASESYSEEELVAEIGACYLAASAGIDPAIDNSAAYLRGWVKKLRDDHRFIFKAASAAQKAADYVLGVVPDYAKDDADTTEQPAVEEAAAS